MVFGGFAVITILTKNSVLEEIRKQYVLTARAKGVDERDVLWRHVFRNALIPIMTGFPAAFVGAFFSGSLLIETLFSLDGLGLLSYESVIRRDYPVVLRKPFRVHDHRPRHHAAARPELRLGRPARQVFRLMPWRHRLQPSRTPRPDSHGESYSTQSPARRAWRRFRSNRLGYVSLIVFAILFGVSLLAEVLSNDKPLVARYEGQWYLPDRADAAGDHVRRRLPDADRLSRSADPRKPREAGQLRAFSAQPLSPQHDQLLRQGAESRARRAPTTCLGTDDRGRDLLARLLYGFRVSVVFALLVTGDLRCLRRALRRDPGLLRRLDRHRAWSDSTRSGARCRRSTC